MSRTVDVEIRIPADMGGLDNATVHVRLDDVSSGDGSVRTVAEQVLQGQTVWPDSTVRARLVLPDDAFNPRADYNVRVRVSQRDGLGESADYVSTERHPVLTYGRPSRVAVPLKLVAE